MEPRTYSKTELMGANIGALNTDPRAVTRQTANIKVDTAEFVGDYEELIISLSPATNSLIRANDAFLGYTRAENSQAIKDLNTVLSGGMKQSLYGNANKLLNSENIEIVEEEPEL